MPIDKTLHPMPTAYQLFETAFGICGIAWNDTGLCRVQLPESDIAATEHRIARGDVPRAATTPGLSGVIIERLQRYFAGERIEFDRLQLDFSGIGQFEADVYSQLRNTTYGFLTTYGTLAQAVGSPKAARAVGMAMGRNPWPVVVPCHRVLGANQAMTGFSAPGGISTKQRLLRLEGAGGAEQLDLF